MRPTDSRIVRTSRHIAESFTGGVVRRTLPVPRFNRDTNLSAVGSAGEGSDGCGAFEFFQAAGAGGSDAADRDAESGADLLVGDRGVGEGQFDEFAVFGA